MFKPIMVLIVVWLSCCAVCATVEAAPELVSLQKIWDFAPHNAFTDLIRFQDRWWCTFREATQHGADEGKTRIIVSDDGETWSSAALMSESGIDLRDAKLSVMPDGRLMCNMGGVTWSGGTYVTRAPRMSFSTDGYTWTAPQAVLDDDPAMDHWLWRVTWKDGVAWSMSKLGEGTNPRRIMLYNSTNGLDWTFVTEPILPDNAENGSETTLRFLPDDTMVALTRPEWIGTSPPPYTNWSWTRLDEIMGGPNFLRLPNGELWASARRYGVTKTTVLAAMTTTNYVPVLTLPSGGDNSYPGMVWHDDGLLWMSYYSSHEGTGADIYLAKIRLGPAGSPRPGRGYKAYVVAPAASTAGERDKVYCYDAEGQLLWEGTDPSSADENVISIAFGPDDLLYVPAWDGQSLFRFARTGGAYLDQFAILPFPVDLAFGPDGNLYIVHGDGPVEQRGVHRYNGATGEHIDHFVQWEPQGQMRGLAFGPDGNLYVAGGTKVGRYDGATGALIDWFATGTYLDRLLWHEGILHVGEKGPNIGGWNDPDGSVLRFDASGAPLGALVATGAGGLKSPEGLAFTPDNDLLVCDYYPDHKVRRYNGTTGAYVDDFAAPDGWPRDLVVETLPAVGALLIAK